MLVLMKADLFLLALTVFLEARGEPEDGQYAVAHVPMNRVEEPHRYGESLQEVILQPMQFSCFNDLPASVLFRRIYAEPAAFGKALAIAENVMCGGARDSTGGANHYFADSIDPPSWADPRKQTCQIGRHKFFKL